MDLGDLEDKNMKIYILIIFASLVVSCSKDKQFYEFMPQSGFVEKPGIYRSKNVIINVKKYDNGSLTFGVADRKYKIIYQQSVFSSFSDNAYWFIYKDKYENIWFYSSDIQQTTVIMKNGSTNSYSIHNFCKEKIKLPKVIPKNHYYCL